MLNRSLNRLQWFSVFMLCGGVTLVQWKPAEATKVQVGQHVTPSWLLSKPLLISCDTTSSKLTFILKISLIYKLYHLFCSSLLILFSQIEQNPVIGFIAIAVAVLCSGFAGKTSADDLTFSIGLTVK